MLLTSPIVITPRLLPGVIIGGAFLSIEYSDRNGERGRTRYRYHIDLSTGRGGGRRSMTYTNDDLQSGRGGGDLQSGLASLLDFLCTCGESYGYQTRTGRAEENDDLFPRAIAQWAAENTDKLTAAELELSENPDLIIE